MSFWRILFDWGNILQTFTLTPSKLIITRLSSFSVKEAKWPFFIALEYHVFLTCCSITMITNSPIKHRKKPGAIPCHSATKTSVKKCERSLFPRKRSLLYKYLVMKKDDIIRFWKALKATVISIIQANW